MNFPYIRLPGLSKRPLAKTYFKYRERVLTNPVFCLVDSGADVSYLDMGIADLLGIDLSKTKSVPSWGINSQEFKGYPARVTAIIDDWELEIVAIFSPEVGRMFCVLGQEGLFDQARVTFERYKWNMDIRPRTDVN